ncbi:MAG: alpha/beta fold hydrolase [Ignavibacteria bacterium]|nr:alpha/beta fold hydrolase [Ignavibacteria bacterium]
MKYFIIYLTIFIISTAFDCSENKVYQKEVPDSINNNQKEIKLNNPELKLEITNKEFSVITADKKKIFGSLFYSDEKKNELQPVVILIHQFNQTKEQWKLSFIDSLISSGFKVLSFDIRGHGKSDKQNGKLEDILTDPEQAPNDITAIVDWVKRQQGIDSTRVAAIGTSIGGNLALYAGLNLGLKVTVAVSNGKSTFESYTGYNEKMMGRPFFPKIKNVLLVCGSKDDDHETGQKWILDNFCSEPKEMKVYNSDKHGKFLIDSESDLNSIMINWIKKYL